VLRKTDIDEERLIQHIKALEASLAAITARIAILQREREMYRRSLRMAKSMLMESKYA
jgi:hypothetical protein